MCFSAHSGDVVLFLKERNLFKTMLLIFFSKKKEKKNLLFDEIPDS